MTIMEKLKELRINSNYTQKQLADFLDIDQTTLSKIESGERSISMAKAERLALLYGYDINSIKNQNQLSSPVKIAFRASEVSKDDLNAIAEINKIVFNMKLINEIKNKGK